jgi:hypothetical protein
MAEETVTSRDEVELDTDGVNEETVSVEQEKETEIILKLSKPNNRKLI